MMIVLNEQKWAKNVLLGKIDVKGMNPVVQTVTRYNHHVLHLDPKANYDFTVKWLNVHCRIFSEYDYSDMINHAIQMAGSRPFYNIDCVEITQSEIDKILTLNDLKLEKIMFVLLCLSKIQRVVYKFENNFVNCKTGDLFKYARVNMPAADRDSVLFELKERGFISFPHKIDSSGLFVMIVDQSEAVLRVSEIDCQELAYVYLRYTKKAKIKRCSECNRLMKPTESGLCAECMRKDISEATIKCIDCGVEVVVKKFDTSTCRCEYCQTLNNRAAILNRVRKHRCNAALVEIENQSMSEIEGIS